LVAAVAVKGFREGFAFQKRAKANSKLATKVARGHQDAKFPRRLTSTNRRSIHMPKMKTKSGAKKRFPRASRWDRQARPGLQASHPDQEVHQEQAPPAWAVAVHETNMGHMAQMLPFAGL
jgi:large subunit ribosomal protein L35